MLLTSSKLFHEIKVVTQGAEGVSPMHYLLSQFRVMVTYIRLAFFPFNQNLDYDYPVFKNIFELPVLTGFLFLVSILFGAKHLFSKYRLVSFSIFWFFLTLLPESSFLPIKDVIFEHRLYLPLVGYSIFLVSGAYYLFGKNNLKTMVIGLSLIIACYSVLTYQRNKVWKDDLTLWNDAVTKSPNKARPYNNRGIAYVKQGKLAQALSDYNKAIEIDPNYTEAYNNRGAVYNRQHKFTQALSDYDKALEISPKCAEAYGNRGVVEDKEGNVAQALSDYDEALAINPDYAEAYNNRGCCRG